MLMRLWVFLCNWLKLMRSLELVAGYNLTGQLTRLSFRYPFQLALGAMTVSYDTTNSLPAPVTAILEQSR